MSDLAQTLQGLKTLATEATGLEIIKVSPPAGVPGLPSEIPLVKKHGSNPSIENIKDLIDEWRTKPERKTGTERALTLQSFIDLLNRHKTAESAVFANTDWKQPSLNAVIDYHPRENSLAPADNCDFAVLYNYPLSEQWKEWIKKNGEAMGQAEFAAFIEDHIFDLATPEPDQARHLEQMFGTRIALPVDLMQLSRGLQINVDSSVRQVTNLQTGEAQIAFEETHKDSTGKPIQVPGMFLLKIAPFFMGDVIDVPVRLRYRVNGGKITWAYQIYRPDIHVTEHVREALEIVREATELPVYEAVL